MSQTIANLEKGDMPENNIIELVVLNSENFFFFNITNINNFDDYLWPI